VRATAVVNATGPWSDAVRRLSQPAAPKRLSPTKGIHLIVDRTVQQGLFIQSTSDRRMIFVLPWGGHTLVGTTETDVDAPLDQLQAHPDEMGYLLDAMSPSKVDGQRDVVKNERRQRYENQPYGMVWIVMARSLYDKNHPYSWPTIGSMEDLSAASYEDVVHFFKTYYVPNNTSIVIAGDIDPVATKTLVEKWFNEIPAGKPVPPVDPPAAVLTEQKRMMFEDRVQLPRLFMAWLTPPLLTPGDAEMDILANLLAGGKNSRLYKRLVYDMQIAQDVSAFQSSSSLSSAFWIISTAREGHTLAEIESVIEEEIGRIQSETPSDREVTRAINQYEAGFLDGLETAGGKADQLNAYFTRTGNPDYFNEDLMRYKALDPTDIQAAAQAYLPLNARVVLSVVPEGKKQLAAEGSMEVKP